MYKDYLKNKSERKRLADELIAELERICLPSKDLELLSVEARPLSWLSCWSEDGITIIRPDLYVVTSYVDYIDHWLIEIDLGDDGEKTEKCLDYLRYYQTAAKPTESDLFPVVVWVAKNEARKQQLRRTITEQLPPHHKMFLIITPDELEKMLRQMIDTKELC